MEETGNFFSSARECVCDVIIIVSTQPEDDFSWTKQKQRIEYFLY